MAIPSYIIPYVEEAYLEGDTLVYVEGEVLNGFISNNNVITSTFNSRERYRPSFTSTGTVSSSFGSKERHRPTFGSTGTIVSSFASRERHRPSFTSTGTIATSFNTKTSDKSSLVSTNTNVSTFGPVERIPSTVISTNTSASTFNIREVGVSQFATDQTAIVVFQSKELSKLGFASSNISTSVMSLLTVDPEDPAFLSLDIMSSNANPLTPDKAFSLDGDVPPPELKRLPAFSETTNMSLTFQLNVTQPVQPLQINNIVVSPAIDGVSVNQTGNNQITVSGKPKIKTQTEIGQVNVVGETIDGNIDDMSPENGFSLYDFNGDERQFVELSITIVHNWGTVVTKMSINNDWEANRIKALEFV